ncbi:DUF262 domain-containing protein [Calothrix sp. FACHB-1219]|uniref:DUF262 domain-containing protein n=1 Tax=unclassified Calothrix TaxID=2619626 RepID=UPI001689EB15|nr:MULTISPECIES: DUF262 domain-containing protein [unclassified Calothrix]MBD2203172.1 DUF262 domain-containing protein [Calothrix sp. FACHB-168]MBD2218772.1 DUF262 domain-containing protein [Calothrix sp. FACHB-1219]
MSKNGIATNKKVLDLFNMMKNGTLILAPSFQRKLVWNDAHKEKFIETILLKLPFPEIYLADGEIDLDTQTSKTLVVDGQQRLSTIYQYVTASPEFTIKNINKYENLTTQEKTDFFDYTVVVRDLGRIPESEIREVFKRINSVQYALNAIEISNSLYEGEFITTAKDILENNAIFTNLEVFSEGEFSRMKDLEYVLLIMSTIEEGGYFASDKEVKTYVEKYNNEYTNKNLMLNNFHEVSKLIIACNIPSDSLWIKKSSLFTLIVELIKIKNKYGYLPKEETLIHDLNSLEEQLYNNKKEDVSINMFAQYYYYTHQGTASRKGRNVRGQLINRILEASMNVK